MSYLSLRSVRKSYPDGTLAVRGVDLDVMEGEFIVLLGPSGCGKTTTLRMVAGLESCSAGRIELAGDDVTDLRPSLRNIGMVFQFYALYPHLSVEDNIAFPLRSVGESRRAAAGKVRALAERMGIVPLLSRRPRELSGGDQQRVSLARVLVRSPRLQLMDEPLGTLDADGRGALRELIRDRHLHAPITTLYVTHDQEEAMVLADRVVVMSGGEIRQCDTPRTIYDRPRDLFVAKFVGSPGMNLSPGQLVPAAGRGRFEFEGGGCVQVPAPPSVMGALVLGVRPEHCRLVESGALSGRVVLVEYLGAVRNAHVEGAFGRWLVRCPIDHPVREGDLVGVDLDWAHALWFDAVSERAL